MGLPFAYQHQSIMLTNSVCVQLSHKLIGQLWW